MGSVLLDFFIEFLEGLRSFELVVEGFFVFDIGHQVFLDLAFGDFETLLNQQGWIFKRQTGSHAIWNSPKGYRLVIQNKNGKAKGYQVKQFLAQVEVELM